MSERRRDGLEPFVRIRPGWRGGLGAIARVFFVALGLNIIWEFAQMPLYSAASNQPGHEWICLRASVFDAVYITGVYLILAAYHRSLRWVQRWGANDVIGLTAVGLLVAYQIERQALLQGRWSYGSAMPLVLGVGLTPLVQLALLSLVTFEVIRRCLVPFIPPPPTPLP